jgi:hypothetical protein
LIDNGDRRVAGYPTGTAEVRARVLRAGYEFPADGAIPEHAIAAYNETHPDRPY